MDTLSPPAHDAVVRLTRTFAAKPERVFRAWTDPDEVRVWFGPKDVTVTAAAIDLRVGGTYIFTMKMASGAVAHNYGVYREIVAAERLVFTWRLTMHQTDGTTTNSGESLVTATLQAHAGTTELTLTHERLMTDDARAGVTYGWTGSFDKLAEIIDSEGSRQ